MLLSRPAFIQNLSGAVWRKFPGAGPLVGEGVNNCSVAIPAGVRDALIAPLRSQAPGFEARYGEIDMRA